MTNIVVLCHGRYRLTMQCLNSIRANTKEGEYNLTIVSDDEQDFRVRDFLRDQVLYHPKNTTMVSVTGSRHCLGALKNLGVMHSESTFGRGDWLCVLDNDVCVFQDWLERLSLDNQSYPVIIGGCRHPYHQPNPIKHEGWVETDAVAGYCHFMPWMLWDYVGPYNADASGIGQSEDFAICRRVNDLSSQYYSHIPRRMLVGYADPPVMAHCGITDSNGKPIAGAELIEQVPGVLYL